MRPIYGYIEKIRDSLTTPTAIFPKIFRGLLFQLTLRICVQNLKSVDLPVPGIIGCPQNWGLEFWERGALWGRGRYHSKERW